MIYIIGTPIHSYTRIVNESFVANGVASQYDTYDFPNSFLKSIPFVSSFYNIITEYRSGLRFYNKLKSTNFPVKILLLFGMNNIAVDKLKSLKATKNIKIAIWFIDSIYNYKKLFEVIDIADYIFCYNKSDADYLQSQGKNSIFLPLAYDSNSYFPLECKKVYDLYFVGTLKSRIDFLDKLFLKLESYNLSIRVDGKLSFLFRIINKTRYPNFFRYHTNIKPDHKRINECYNKSKICLNNQPAQAESGFSIRTYEICGAGGFQITNGNRKLLNELFTVGNDLEFYNDLNELTHKIVYFIKSSNREKLLEISKSGHVQAVEKHSFKKRIGEIIRVFDNHISI